MSDEYIKKFYNEVNESLEGNYKIILEPNRNLTDEWIEYDQVKWELDESLQKLVNTLLEEDTIDFEEKVLRIYKYICLNYVYDDNVLYFFKKDSSDPNNIKYIAVDWYGRIIDKKWKENRKNHNRRVCYEFARFYAKAINEMLIGHDNCEAFMLGDKENLHYVVGLTGNEYSIILDPDDFNNIKDLTRLKLGLTINGIKILRDNSGKFQKAVDKFNQDKKNELPEVEKTRENLKDGNFIEYFKSVVEILKSYNIDSQGFYEYMKSIVEQEEIETEKVWKKINGDNEKRYARCSIFNLDSKTYLLDSVDKTLSIINNENLDIEGTACGHPVIATNAGGIPGILNTENANISDKSQTYKTPLGILVPPLPDRNDKLDDKQKDELDKFMTEYVVTKDEDKDKLIDEICNNLNLPKDVVINYTNAYMRTIKGISDSVIEIVSKKGEFNNEEIAKYTKDRYSQDTIRNKLLGIFDEAVRDHSMAQDR